MTIYGKESFTKIVTVLRSGGDYQRIHVEKIRDMVERYVSEFEFICLTDSPTEEYDRPLKHDWPGWWAKMEIFNIPGPVLFLDLDTIIVDNIDCIIKSLKDQPFVTLRDAFRGGSNIGSGIMSWSKNVSYLYRAFAKDDKRFMRELRGDQDFLQHAAKENTFMQDYYSGIVSFKADILNGWLYNPLFHKIVFFHGTPRPWQQDVVPY